MTLNTPTVNTKWSVHSQTGTSVTATSASFTPSANALLVLGICVNRSSAGQDTRVTSVTTSGLTWTKQAQCSYTGTAAATLPAGGTAQAGTGTEIWTTSVGASPAAMTVAIACPVSSSVATDIYAEVMMVTDSGGSVPTTTNAATASSSSGLPSKAITTSAGSYVVAARSDWAAAGAGTLGTSPAQTAIFNDAGTVSDFSRAYWRTTSTTSAGTVTMAMTAPSAQNYNMAVLEVQVPSGGGSAGSVTAVPATASAAGVVPTVAAASTVDNTGAAANASAAAPLPGITIGMPVAAVPATASAASTPPGVTGAVNLGAVASASAAAPLPGLQGGSPVTAVPASGSATAPSPGLAGAVGVIPPTATGSASATPPVVSGSYVYGPPSASASAAAPAPQVGNVAQVNAVPATASAVAAVPDVAGALNYTVTASASAVAPPPSVSGADSVAPPAAVATAACPVPTVSGGTGSSGSNVNAVPAVATAAAGVPDVAGNDAVFSVGARADAFATAPTVSGGTAPIAVPAATASAVCPNPAVDGAALMAAVPATASAVAAVPAVAGGGNTPANVTAVAAVASAGAAAPYVTAQLPTYFVGFGGLLDLQHHDTRNVYTVNITDLAHNPAVVFFDQARTQVVPLPYTFNGVGEHLFYFAQDFQGWLSVLKNGEEIAAQPDSDGQLFLIIRSEETFGYSPSRDLI